MKIEAVEVIVLSDKRSSGQPFDPARGFSGSGLVFERPFLRIQTSDGPSGIAELFEVPAKIAIACLHGRDSLFGSFLVGEDPFPPQRHWRRLMGSLIGRERVGWAVMCIGAIDVALWDVIGKSQGRPVHNFFGGADRPPLQVSTPTGRTHVTPYATVYALDDDPRQMISRQLGQVERVLQLGYQAIKIEPVMSEPNTVIELARRTRQMIGDERRLIVDVAYLWNDVSTARFVASRIAEFDICWLETPFPVDAVRAYSRFSMGSPVPIGAGEMTTTSERIIELMDFGGVNVVLPYATTVGGFTEIDRVIDGALRRGVQVCPGGWGTPITFATHVQVAAWSLVTPLFEYVPPEIYDSPLRRALSELGGPRPVDGLVPIPTTPGIGVDLDDAAIASFRIA